MDMRDEREAGEGVWPPPVRELTTPEPAEKSRRGIGALDRITLAMSVYIAGNVLLPWAAQSLQRYAWIRYCGGIVFAAMWTDVLLFPIALILGLVSACRGSRIGLVSLGLLAVPVAGVLYVLSHFDC